MPKPTDRAVWDQISGFDGRVSLQSSRRFRSAKYQLPSILANVSRYGLGSRLVQRALDDLRARGLALVPLCPFVADFVGRHPEYADLVTTGTGLQQ